MVISCDPPRHALLCHLGIRDYSHWPSVVSAREGVQFAMDSHMAANRPRLVAVHVVRHNFYLPFVDPERLTINHSFYLRAYTEDSTFCLDLVRHPEKEARDALDVGEGVSLLVTRPKDVPDWLEPMADRRPMLWGMRVDLGSITIDLSLDEIEIEIGADTLKDVDATLFCRKKDCQK